MSDIWIADNDTYNKLQHLKLFVNFVAGPEYVTVADKQKALSIKA